LNAGFAKQKLKMARLKNVTVRSAPEKWIHLGHTGMRHLMSVSDTVDTFETNHIGHK
jgi:hypothetical protein